MKFLKKLDEIFDRAMHIILPFFTIVITGLIVVMVVCRYILHMNLGGAEELPTFLMIVCVWVAAAAAARDGGHLKVTILYDVIKNETVKKVMALISNLLEAGVMWIYTYLAYDFVLKSFLKGQISAGLRFPMWWPQSFLLIGSFFMAIYFTVHLVKSIRGLFK